jgi:hypothetical protein
VRDVVRHRLEEALVLDELLLDMFKGAEIIMSDAVPRHNLQLEPVLGSH